MNIGKIVRSIAAFFREFFKPIPPAPEEFPDPVPVPDNKEPEKVETDTQPPDLGFVWKPQSDNDGKAAAVIPYVYNFERLSLQYGNGKEEIGKYYGRGNGHRQTFRFTRQGRAYGKDIVLTGMSRDGKERSWKIPKGSARFESRG